MIKLLNNRVSDPITEETILTYKTALQTVKNLFQEAIVVSDEDLSSRDKLDEKRRRACRISTSISKDYDSCLNTPQSVAFAKNKFTNFDTCDALIEAHRSYITNFQRPKNGEGVEGLNIVTVCKEKIYNQSFQSNPNAIEAANKLDKMPHLNSGDNNGKHKNKDNPPTAAGN